MLVIVNEDVNEDVILDDNKDVSKFEDDLNQDEINELSRWS